MLSLLQLLIFPCSAFPVLRNKFNPLLSLYTITALYRFNLSSSYRLNWSRYDFRAEAAFIFF